MLGELKTSGYFLPIIEHSLRGILVLIEYRQMLFLCKPRNNFLKSMGSPYLQLSWIGIGSTIVECITLADNTQVGAGAVVTQSTQANSLYVGVPAKRIRSLTKI